MQGQTRLERPGDKLKRTKPYIYINKGLGVQSLSDVYKIDLILNPNFISLRF